MDHLGNGYQVTAYKTTYILTEHLHLNESCLPKNSPSEATYIYFSMLFFSKYFQKLSFGISSWVFLIKSYKTKVLLLYSYIFLAQIQLPQSNPSPHSSYFIYSKMFIKCLLYASITDFKIRIQSCYKKE